ncbi:DsbA family protein [Vibrio sp. SCSIO 43136]|uniref:DsbA family protein n=1 Tax=Vibrio sp. SCSIO 43136 TaxID=2819101 RepID=UPI002076106E|nr:DsbA family protein [Vibrio sp. SCSIO 43136]USD64061.1 DsbA family protein [Vibrio sp. SCSIO 43136]
MRFVYVMDPMCGWCYGFQPELDKLIAQHPTAQIDWIMGGLAPDTDQPMDESLKQTIASYWHDIESRAGVTFNHDYWRVNTPYRSTYQACRAVIAAESLEENSSVKMAKAIQAAYYQQAKNPSLDEVLIGCATSFGLDATTFDQSLKSKETETRFQQHLYIAHQLQVRGFPALFYVDENHQAYSLAQGYCTAEDLEQRLAHVTGR